MKTMTCKQLGGACDEAFSANTFDEIVNMSKNHGMKMFKQKDKRHLKVDWLVHFGLGTLIFYYKVKK